MGVPRSDVRRSGAWWTLLAGLQIPALLYIACAVAILSGRIASLGAPGVWMFGVAGVLSPVAVVYMILMSLRYRRTTTAALGAAVAIFNVIAILVAVGMGCFILTWLGFGRM
jgi:Kef-type K+ transport system membrane component KefB